MAFTYTMSGSAQIKLSQWFLQAEKTGHLSCQWQRAQILDREAVAYSARFILRDVGEHLLDLRLHTVLDGLRWRSIVEFIFTNCLQSIVRVSVAARNRSAH